MPRLTFILLALLGPTLACARSSPQSQPSPLTEEEIRQAARQYDEALRRGDVVAVERFWAEEYVFVNPTGERVTKADRMANLRAGRTAFDTLGREVGDEQIRVYGDVAVHTTLLTIGGRYGGRAHRGRFRALVVWVRQDGRWRQVASQLTAVTRP